MTKVDYNIEKFNLYVKSQNQSYVSSGEAVAGLITNLFIVYDWVIDLIHIQG